MVNGAWTVYKLLKLGSNGALNFVQNTTFYAYFKLLHQRFDTFSGCWLTLSKRCTTNYEHPRHLKIDFCYFFIIFLKTFSKSLFSCIDQTSRQFQMCNNIFSFYLVFLVLSCKKYHRASLKIDFCSFPISRLIQILYINKLSFPIHQ